MHEPSPSGKIYECRCSSCGHPAGRSRLHLALQKSCVKCNRQVVPKSWIRGLDPIWMTWLQFDIIEILLNGDAAHAEDFVPRGMFKTRDTAYRRLRDMKVKTGWLDSVQDETLDRTLGMPMVSWFVTTTGYQAYRDALSVMDTRVALLEAYAVDSAQT